MGWSRAKLCVSVSTFLVFHLCLLVPVDCSIGDRQPKYRQCIQKCKTTGCVTLGSSARNCSSLCTTGHHGTALLSLLWSCEADCRYRCMWLVEDQRKQGTRTSGNGTSHHVAYKYHGKWPFIRVLGMQEICSVVASLANLAAHLFGFSSLLATVRTVNRSQASGVGIRGYPMHVWNAYFAASCLAWSCSAAFHTRDARPTEAADYGSANIVVATGLWASVSRCMGKPQGQAAGALILIGLCCHIGYMNLVKFDYGWNMQLCVFLGLVQSGLWVGWTWRTTHPGRRKLWSFVLCLNLAMLLEVLDFPPLFALLDAHAAWHLATVPLVRWWYSFLQADVIWANTSADKHQASFTDTAASLLSQDDSTNKIE